jgi:hypothetical protein
MTQPFLPELSEVQQAKNIIAASQDAGVKFLVWSSLPDASKVSAGKYTKIEFFNRT